MLPSERGGHPIEDFALHDQADPVLRCEDMFRNAERRPHAMLDRVVGLRADERFAAGVDDDHDVPGPLPFVFVREETVEPSGRLPVDPAHLVARRVLPNAPEVRAGADLPRGDLPIPRTRAARLELGPPEVFHRRRDDETGLDRKGRILRPEGERIQGPRAHRSDPEIAFHRRPRGVRERDRAASLQRHDRMVRPVDDRELPRQDVDNLDEIQRRALVPDDELHLDVPAGLGSVARESPDGNETRSRGRKQRAQGQDDHRRQREQDDLPAPDREPCDQEPEGRRREATREGRAHVTAPWARGPARARPPGSRRSGRLESRDPVSG